jgi:hypothetical protein
MVRVLEIADAGMEALSASIGSIGTRLRRASAGSGPARCLWWELRIRRAEAGIAATAAGDQDLVAGGGAFHPVAEVVAELAGADGDLIAGLKWS